MRMSLSHLKRYKVSFVEFPGRFDIGTNKLALGDCDVYLFTQNDDKSS
jgi:hypothetical protein